MIDETRIDEAAKLDLLVEKGTDICFVVQDLEFAIDDLIVINEILDADNQTVNINFTTTKDLQAQTIEYFIGWETLQDLNFNSSYYYTSILESGNGLKSCFIKGVIKIVYGNSR